MKRIITQLFCLFIFSSLAVAQTTVSGTLRAGSGISIDVLARPSADINAQVGNINITISIPDQTASGGNPTEASIVKSTSIANVTLSPTDANNPYIIGGRAYYSYLILQTNTSSDVPTSWAANTDNVVATFTFPSSSYLPAIQLNDLTYDNGGPNFQMYWYVQFNNGVGDVTDLANPFYGTGAQNNGGTAMQYAVLQPANPVPVKFLDFSVAKKDKDAVISWAVENEDENADKYIVERSVNGNDFKAVETVPALNNGSSNNTYTVTQRDINAIANSGLIYYRVKQVDKGGKSVYTATKNIKLDSKVFAVKASPNLVRTTTTLTIDLAKDSRLLVSVTDANGKQIKNIQLQGFKGTNIKELNLDGLAAGNYMLKVNTGEEVKTLPIVKAN